MALAIAIGWIWVSLRRRVEALERRPAKEVPCHRVHLADLRVPSPSPSPLPPWLTAEDLPPFRGHVADEDESNPVLGR